MQKQTQGEDRTGRETLTCDHCGQLWPDGRVATITLILSPPSEAFQLCERCLEDTLRTLREGRGMRAEERP